MSFHYKLAKLASTTPEVKEKAVYISFNQLELLFCPTVCDSSTPRYASVPQPQPNHHNWLDCLSYLTESADQDKAASEEPNAYVQMVTMHCVQWLMSSLSAK